MNLWADADAVFFSVVYFLLSVPLFVPQKQIIIIKLLGSFQVIQPYITLSLKEHRFDLAIYETAFNIFHFSSFT